MTQFISFPGLFSKIFEVNNVAFSIGDLHVKWYGVILATAFILGAMYVLRKCNNFGTNSDTVIDLLLFILPMGILGARIYYVANTWDYYSKHLSEIPQIWNGGLAIYGAIIAGIIVIFIFNKFNKHRFDAISFLDIASIGLILGQAIGRWGNFVNGEAFGTATTLPIGMVISDTMTSVGTAVHPTFFYEFFWNLIGFAILHFSAKQRKFKSEIFAKYCVWYGLGRGFIEGLRTDSLYIGSTDIRISQVVAFAGFAVGVAYLAYMYITKKYKTSKLLSLENSGEPFPIVANCADKEKDGDTENKQEIADENTKDGESTI